MTLAGQPVFKTGAFSRSATPPGFHRQIASVSEGLGSWLNLVHLNKVYHHLARPDLTHAVARGLACAIVVLGITALLNRMGFRLKL